MEDMRSIPLIDRLSIEVTGSVTSSTICLGDVDNDGEFELCIGSPTGQLSIFKGGLEPNMTKREAALFLSAVKLGHIVAIACGDIFNRGDNVLVCISADGHCKVFDFAVVTLIVDAATSPTTADKTGAANDGKDSTNRKHQLIQPCFTQRLPPNIKHVQISDVNGDGLNELIVTLTDRVVRTYQWRKSSKEGELMALSKWEFADQVGSFAMCQRNGEPHLLVTQSDGILMKPKDEDHFQMTNILEQQFFEKEMPPEVATDLRVNGKPTPSLVVASGNTVYYLHDDKVIWKCEFDNYLFGLSKLDVNDDGTDEVVVVSSTTGQTYIIDAEGKASIFHFDDEICGFSCGLFTVDKKTLPCLVYATFNGQVHVYYSLEERQVRCGLPLSRNLSPDTISRLLYQ